MPGQSSARNLITYFFVVIQPLYLASAAAKAIAAIPKDLGGRFAEVAGSIKRSQPVELGRHYAGDSTDCPCSRCTP